MEEVGDARQHAEVIGGPGRGARGELAGDPLRLRHLERQREVDLQAAEAGVAINPARPEGGLGVEPLGDRGRGCLDEPRARRQGEERQLLRRADARIDAGRRHRFEPAQDLDPGAGDAAQGRLLGLVGCGARGGREAWVGEVEPGFDAFVADPVSVGPADAGVRQLDAGQRDPTVRFAQAVGGGELRRRGAGIADERHHVEALRVVGAVPREVRGRVVGDRADEREGLDARGTVVPAAHEPGRRLGGFVGAPHAGPEGIPDRGPIPAGLHRVGADVGARRRPAVGAGFLLEVGERQAEGDHRLHAGPAPGDGIGGQLRLDLQERDERDDDHEHERHDRQREHQGETTATGGTREGGVNGGSLVGHGVGVNLLSVALNTR